MTRKKESVENNTIAKKDKSVEKGQSHSEIDSQEIKEELKEEKNLDKSTEVKQISGTEPGKLEYYSKEHLIEKIDNLESNLKNQTDELKKLKEESESWKSKYMRLQAEFENAQKRWDKNRKNLRLEYTALVLKSFLPLYDSFKKALSNDKENMKILKGFYDQFMNILKSYKAEPMEVKENEPFDYSTQEALTSIEKTDIPKNTILEVIQDGWKLENEVLRFTKVIISKEPKPPEPEPEPEPEVESVAKTETEPVKQQPKEAESMESDVSDKKSADETESNKSKKEEKKTDN